MKADLTPLNHAELLALFEALRTVGLVIDGLALNPHLTLEGMPTAAGKILEKIARRVGMLGDDIATHIRTIPSADAQSRRSRVHLLLQDEARFLECDDMDAAEQALALIDRGGI